MKTLSKLTILALSLLLASAAWANKYEETFKKVIDADNVAMLTVESRNGKIEVSSWNKDKIEIIAYKRVSAPSRSQAQDLFEELIIEVEEQGNSVDVFTEWPRYNRNSNSGFMGWLFGGSSYSYSVSYEIKVPEKMDMDLKSTNGRLEVFGIEGRMRLKTTNGKIVGEDLRGSVRCKTTNGSINVALEDVTERDEMSFETTNGSVKVYLPRNIDADLRAKTTNGSIRCELNITEEYSHSKKRMDAVINDGGTDIYIRTTNGSIKLYEI